jgi:hypothetical protein
LARLFKILSAASIGIILLYLSPLVFNLWNWEIENVFPEVILDTDYQSSLLRTISYASFSTLGVLLLSFLAGYKLRRLKSKGALLLGGILLLPFLLGSVSSSFLFKVLLYDSSLLNWSYNNSVVLFGLLSLFQFWQFGTLFTYIFWINNLSIKDDLIGYTSYYKLNSLERIKLVYIPYHRNLIILLSIFFFVSNIYESVKLQVIFRASKGTNSELLSNTLYNAYLSDSKISPDYAANVLFSQTALFYLPLFIALTVLLYGLLNYLISSISKSKISFLLIPCTLNRFNKNVTMALLIVFVAGILFPISYAFLQQEIKLYNLSYLLSTIGLSFLASSVLLLLFTLPLSYYLRIVCKEYFYQISRTNLWIFITLFSIFLIPPLTLMLFGFEWSSILGIRGKFATNISWVLGQCISALPIIATFIFVIHFLARNKELEYLGAMKADLTEVIKWSFIKRFRIEYLMTFLFSFSIIWNEGTFNKIYSDRIPSYVSEILRTVNSRNADYGRGMMFFLFSLLLSILCIVIWNVIVARLVSNKQNS